MKPKNKIPDSEKYFTWYLSELRAADYVLEWMPQPQSWTIFDKATYAYTKQLKTKEKRIRATIPGLSKMEYTPDFKILWAPEAKGIFWQYIYGGDKLTTYFPIAPGVVPESIIEVKPDFDSRNMTRAVEPKVRQMWLRYDIYVQIVKPEKLFAATFTPERYLWCDKQINRKRTIKYPVRSLTEYVEGKQGWQKERN